MAIAYEPVDLKVDDGRRELAPGLAGVRFALPFALDHANVWAREEVPGWTIIDTGIADERSQKR